MAYISIIVNGETHKTKKMKTQLLKQLQKELIDNMHFSRVPINEKLYVDIYRELEVKITQELIERTLSGENAINTLDDFAETLAVRVRDVYEQRGGEFYHDFTGSDLTKLKEVQTSIKSTII